MGNADLEQYYIECLRKDIEKEIGRSICTYSDFDFLSLRLRERIPDVRVCRRSNGCGHT